jgi:hypothetical protein
MASSDNMIKKAPSVEREDIAVATCKMASSILIITVIMLMVLYINHDFKHKKISSSCEHDTSLTLTLPVIYNKSSVMGTAIRLSNNNRKIVPVMSISVIDKDLTLHNVSIDQACVTANETNQGVIMTFNIPKTDIVEITVEIDIFNSMLGAITTTKLEVLDNDNVVWTYLNPMKLERYNSIPIEVPTPVINNTQTLDHKNPWKNEYTLQSIIMSQV